MAGRVREQMHQDGLVGLRLRRFDAWGRQSERGDENDETRAYDAKKSVIHGSHRRCNLRSRFNYQGRNRFPGFSWFVMEVPDKELAPAWGERRGHLWGVSGGTDTPG